MRIRFFDWDSHNIEHIGEHHVDTDEVEEAFEGKHYLFRTRDGRYCLLGRSGTGRYLFIVFELRGPETAHPVTARNMKSSDKRLYRKRGKR